MTRRMIVFAALLLTNSAAQAVQELRLPTHRGIQTLQALPQPQPQVRAEPTPRQASILPLPQLQLPGQHGDETRFPDEFVASSIHIALKQIGKAKCGAGTCAPATAEDWERLPVPLRAARHALTVSRAGIMSRVCGAGIEQQLFLALMKRAREDWRFDDRQAAMIAFIHGMFSAAGAKIQNEPCPDTMRDELVAYRAAVFDARRTQ